MKKNYIAPNTEMTTWASMGLMQDPLIGIATGSGSTGVASTNDMDFIQ